jgi:hypothetical protein
VFCWIGTSRTTSENFSNRTVEQVQDGRRYHPVVTSERLARAHIEDVLSITIELEKVKHALESEQMKHDETKSDLLQAKSKNSQAESQIEKLLNDMETNRENDARKIRELEEELRIVQFRERAAEEDAQIALDLAKENVENRQKVEAWLQKALDEIQLLREHVFRLETQDIQEMKIETNAVVHSNRGEMETRRERYNVATIQSITEIPNSKPSQALVTAGKEIAQRLMNQKPVSIDESIRAAADISRRLRNRLKSFEEEDAYFETYNGNNTPVNSPARRSPRRDLGSAVEALDVCRKSADVLKESGRRLHLTGRWWTGTAEVKLDEIHLETLARHYCTAVEVTIFFYFSPIAAACHDTKLSFCLFFPCKKVELERKHRDIVELESLISIWEKGTSFDDSIMQK